MILHTELKGGGEAIVFLHTGFQTAATDFIQQQNTFMNGYRIISPDLRGHGKSATVDISNFFEDSADDLAETLEGLGIQKTHIVGASLGALAALSFAKRYPDKLKSLTISGVTKGMPENWLEMHQEDVKMQAELMNNEEALMYFNDLHGPGWTRFIEMGRSEDWYPFHETGDLSGISAPILVIAGETSPHEVKSLMDYRAEFNNVHIATIPFAAHLVHAEQPELYSKVLELFLKNL
ncbi:alpha/beta fold hydrolase [Planococcus salinarum]|uniref:alpha/beta fold hydrolase n=1 Tax=Planococcus salinarum TaxID=622695 RepID=UPI000E3E77E1|nr:alpha/beta hydrolase [Planococcus salinarum]TAA72683.1 alpha/beta hydrolase [Planococcus salinarum]